MVKKILLVEDEAIIAMSEAKMLQKHGYEVITVYNGQKAIEKADTAPNISLILMDIDLGPGIDGTETAQEILKKHDLPIAFLSSHTEPNVVERTEGITSYGYIVKNSGETVLLAAIKMALRLFEAKMKEKEHKKALLHSHDLMSYIIEHNQSAVAVHDKELNYIYVSKQYLNQFNVEKRDVIGKHHYEVFPDLPQKWREVHQRALAGEVSHGEDDPYERDDGTIAWTRWECRPWYEADNSIGGIIIYTEVLSQEKQMHSDTRETVNYLQSILRTTRDGFWVLDSRGNFIDVNNAYCRMSGYKRDEILHMRIPDIDVDDQPQDVADRIKRITSTGNEIFQARHRRKDESTFDVEISASFLGGRQDKIICFCRDITQRKRAEEALQESEKKYRSLFNNLRDAVIVVNKNREITDCNPAFTDLFGYTLAEIQGKTTAMLFATDEHYAQLGKMMQEQGDNTDFIYQPIYRKKTGETFRGEKKVQYLKDESGERKGFIGLIRDISE
ncbi:MAG: PAS domain S-box protein [Spirochaetia bacterium]|nr:PAS domain S-box protein [Spirochaetia bacterium]